MGRRLAEVVSCGLLAVALAACDGSPRAGKGDPDEPSSAPVSASPADATTASTTAPPSASPSAEPSFPVTGRGARQAFRAAYRNLVDASTGSYELEIPLGQGVRIVETGDYSLRPLAYEAVRWLPSPDGPLAVRSRAVGKDFWFRLESDSGAIESWRCWVDYDDLVAAGAVPRGYELPEIGLPPLALTAAVLGVGRRVVNLQTIEGAMNLAAALNLISAKVAVSTGVDLDGDAPVPATFTVRHTALAGYSVSMSDMRDAIGSAGGKVPNGFGELARLDATIDTTFDGLGLPVEVKRPARTEVVEFDSSEDFEAALDSCGRGIV